MARSRKSRITDLDKGYKRTFERIARAVVGVHVDVGILGDDASKIHKSDISGEEKHEHRALKSLAKRGGFLTQGQYDRMASLGKRAESSVTIGEIGEWHEFGLGNNPVRSWLRGYVDANRAKIKAKVTRVAERVQTGSMSAEQGMDLLGQSIVGGIRERISAGIAPQVTDATQARKGPGKTTPLINSGQFRSSISHKVATGA